MGSTPDSDLESEGSASGVVTRQRPGERGQCQWGRHQTKPWGARAVPVGSALHEDLGSEGSTSGVDTRQRPVCLLIAWEIGYNPTFISSPSSALIFCRNVRLIQDIRSSDNIACVPRSGRLSHIDYT